VLPDYNGASLDSWGLRATINPGMRSSFAAWYGYVAGGKGLHVHDALHRAGVSWIYAEPMMGARVWALSVIAGANIPTATGRLLPAGLFEASCTFNQATTVFSRVEYVRRTAAELALIGSVPAELSIGDAGLGASRRILGRARWSAWLGGRGLVNLVPAPLEPFYGSRAPLGLVGYLEVRAGTRHS
jgi:hypothetical protein